MKNKEYWIEWSKRAGIRAVKTMAQAAIAGIGTAVVLGVCCVSFDTGRGAVTAYIVGRTAGVGKGE